MLPRDPYDIAVLVCFVIIVLDLLVSWLYRNGIWIFR